MYCTILYYILMIIISDANLIVIEIPSTTYQWAASIGHGTAEISNIIIIHYNLAVRVNRGVHVNLRSHYAERK